MAACPSTSLSSAAQDYLKLIWSATEWTDQPMTVSRLAERLGIRPATASDGIRRLTAQGLVEHRPYGSIELTEDGRRHAIQMVRRHRLLETFLVDVLGYGWDEVHDEAEVLEHAVLRRLRGAHRRAPRAPVAGSARRPHPLGRRRAAPPGRDRARPRRRRPAPARAPHLRRGPAPAARASPSTASGSTRRSCAPVRPATRTPCS
ncbi:metal-dependent transcriptional regulator [Clavibacter tessellarius]